MQGHTNVVGNAARLGGSRLYVLKTLLATPSPLLSQVNGREVRGTHVALGSGSIHPRHVGQILLDARIAQAVTDATTPCQEIRLDDVVVGRALTNSGMMKVWVTGYR